jgi:glutamine kinase
MTPENSILFESKSDTLKFLQLRIKRSKIEKILDFTVTDWKKNKSYILNLIFEHFGTTLVIIRSSAMGEDSHEKSEAGNYDSISHVHTSSNSELKTAINKVISSYRKKGNLDPTNQILIQKQATKIITSGVAFTRSTDNEPYYIINFEDGSATDGVTKGEQGNMIKIFRKIPQKQIPEKWRNIIKSFKEIEKVTNSSRLDIEFAITKNKQIVIFQVRPLISQSKKLDQNIDGKISSIISFNKKNLEKYIKRNYLNKKIIFSDMSDWNPAEILGNNPNFLDYSLYDYLIMKSAWTSGRTILGYPKINSSLMVKFGNKPYVNVNSSFSSLIPAQLSKKLQKKLMNFYLNKLEQNPSLHDKVEFEILFTCYDLTIDKRLKELQKFNFSKREINLLKISLLNFTNEIISKFPIISKNNNTSITQMYENRTKILSVLAKKKQTPSNLLNAAEQLLHDCKIFGTMPFSTTARIAFIGSILLKSLKNEGFVDSKLIDSFMMSIITPSTEIQNDFDNYLRKKISKKIFLKKYGHLRPGTYDITALRYDADNQFFKNMTYSKKKQKNSVNINEEHLSKKFKKHKLIFDKINFLDFVKESLIQREKLKFEFTKNLSKSLELIVEAGEKLGFTRNDLAYLEISDILKNKSNVKSTWQRIINKNFKKKKLNDLLILPPLIFSKKDFDVIQYYLSKPNYITSKKISKKLLKITNSNQKSLNLKNKIVLIENADPGYDWIFTRNPSGLITKYGGVASHMAIRCSELGLPAAIGCGEILFDKLLNSKEIILDCQNMQIIFLKSNIDDEYFEEKRVLKSLGYIK